MRLLKSLILNVLLLAIVLARRFRYLFGKPSGVIILPPESPGSLGDEAMMVAVTERLRAMSYKRIGVISYSRLHPGYPIGEHRKIDLTRYFSWNAWSDRCRFIFLSVGYKSFICLGADVLDGFYSVERSIRRIELVALAAKVGIHSRIMGFSINEAPNVQVMETFKSLPGSVRLFARDPLSLERLYSKAGVSSTLSADVAFLLNPATTSTTGTIAAWISGQKLAGRAVIGIKETLIKSTVS